MICFRNSIKRPGNNELEHHQPAKENRSAVGGGFDVNATRHEGAMLCGSYSMTAIAYSSSMSHLDAVLHTLKPILNKVVDEFDGKIHFVEIDIEQDRDIAEQAGVAGTPTFSSLRTRAVESKGIKPKSQYRQLIESHL